MNSYRSVFDLVSYLQYIFYFAGIVFIGLSIYEIIELIKNSVLSVEIGDVLELGYNSWNLSLFMLGLGVSFSTLQDPSKTQNSFSKKVWQDPQKGKKVLVLMMGIALFFIIWGLLGLIVYTESIIGRLSYGFLAFGIAYISVVRAAIEMFENHRTDKLSPVIK